MYICIRICITHTQEHMALVVQARKTELASQARVATGEELHVELSQREMAGVGLVTVDTLDEQHASSTTIDWV